jgi:hypothetical protein
VVTKGVGERERERERRGERSERLIECLSFFLGTNRVWTSAGRRFIYRVALFILLNRKRRAKCYFNGRGNVFSMVDGVITLFRPTYSTTKGKIHSLKRLSVRGPPELLY